MITDAIPLRPAEESVLPESYPSFWDAIPVDPVRENTLQTPRLIPSPRLGNQRTHEEAGPVYLSVEQQDVGLG
jgi:hypothetical protein